RKVAYNDIPTAHLGIMPEALVNCSTLLLFRENHAPTSSMASRYKIMTAISTTGRFFMTTNITMLPSPEEFPAFGSVYRALHRQPYDPDRAGRSGRIRKTWPSGQRQSMDGGLRPPRRTSRPQAHTT